MAAAPPPQAMTTSRPADKTDDETNRFMMSSNNPGAIPINPQRRHAAGLIPRQLGLFRAAFSGVVTPIMGEGIVRPVRVTDLPRDFCFRVALWTKPLLG